MRISYRQIGVVALFALFVLVSGCGGKNALSQEELVGKAFDDLRAQVAQVIADAERERTALNLVNRLEKDYETLYDKVLERRTRVRALNADYDATRESFVALVAQLDADVRRARKSAGLTHRQFVAAATPDEWATIAKANTRAMKAAIGALQSI